MRQRRHTVLSSTLIAAVLVPGGVNAIDLTGKWRFGSPGVSVVQLSQVTQSGSTLSFSLGDFAFSGTVSTGGPFATFEVTASDPPAMAGIDGRIMPSGNLLDGRAVTFFPSSGYSVGGLVATRCTCDDGNTTNGDGCDAECRVEPCWTCAGDPSVCTPVADGSACEDGSACTSGETCTAAVCAGGTTVSPCTDMTGRWNRHQEITAPAEAFDFATDFTQRGTDIIAGSYIGTIDPATGAFDVRKANPSLFCSSFDPLVGSVPPTGVTYAATGSVSEPDPITPDHCNEFSLTEAGTRCGSGTIDLIETCDDGNLSDGDGCSAACAVEPCWTCAGAPSNCVPTPQAACRRSIAPVTSLVFIKQSANDAITWLWKKGAATTLAELGDPVAGDGYTLCVFDESSITPGLLFRARVPGGGTCDGRPCWKPNDATGFGYKSKAATPEGIVVAKLTSGSDGKAKAVLKGKGVHLSDRPNGLPALPLATPLRAQLLGGGGLCLETTFDASSVVKNDGVRGVFKARGTP